MPEPAVDDESQLGDIVSRWDREIEAYKKVADPWIKDGKRIVERYALKDSQENSDGTVIDETRFNILWSNVQTRMPAIFSRAPEPAVERRFRDKDPIGRIASQMLQRALSTDIELDELDVTGEQITEDLELVGRGVPWVRYQPEIVETETVVVQTEDGFADEDGEAVEDAEEQPDGTFMSKSEDIASERAPIEYVYWEDFFHKPVKNWSELEKDGWVARRLFMTKRQGLKRFGPIFKDVPMTATPRGMEDPIGKNQPKSVVKLAEVFEIWDAAEKEVIWIIRTFKLRPLDRKPDPLELENFFPCPRAAYGTLTNESLIPTPDYLQYEPQAIELDDLTERITVLTQALRLVGIYDATMEGLGSLLDAGSSANVMVPVTNMAAVMGKGATGSNLSNVVQFFPVEMVVQVLISLYDARDRVKQVIFEISGVSDILRGQVDPREKLGQSRIKGQFATLRLDRRQKEVSRMLRDAIRIKAEIIAEQFDPVRLREISGFDQLSEVANIREKAAQAVIQQAEQQIQQAQQQGIQALPPNPQMIQLMAQQAGEAAVNQAFTLAAQLIRDDKTRGFRIDIETDSTIAVDEEAAKESRIEFMSAFGTLLNQALPAVQAAPQLGELVGQMLLFTVRTFRAGRSLESDIEEFVDDMSNQPQEQQPDPAMLKLQSEQKLAEGRLQIEREKMQGELQIKQQSAAADTQLKVAQASSPEDAAKLRADVQKAAAQIQLDREVAAANIQLKRDEQEADMALKMRSESVLSDSTQSLASTAQALAQAAQALTAATQVIAESAQTISQAAADVNAPKEIVRDENGRVTGVRKAA